MKKRLFFFAFIFICAAMSAGAAVYEVKPNTPLDTIAEVPWATLQPGDTVLIYWRATPYKEKWVICRQGTANAPITVRGVPNQNGDLPVIDGSGAVTPTNLNFWSEQRGVIKIGGANIPADTMPKYLVIENLEIRSAHPAYQFTDDGGATQTYSSAASSIYVEKGENITVRNCKLHDSANGFFVASSDDTVSRNILVEGNYIFGNGIVGSAFQHNNYTAAIGITFQYNRFGAPRVGAVGNALKDRSAGTVIRYNWIEAGNRQLDLVEGEDSIQIRNAPEYRQTFVYGNILIEPDGAGNSQIAHYGGDNGDESTYRKGKLYFYNNTVVSTRTGNTTLFRLSSNDETCDARNNIFYVTASGANLALLDDTGFLTISHNWFKPGWRNSHSNQNANVSNDGTSVQGAMPGFVNFAAQDFHLASDSAAIDAGINLHTDVLPTHNVVRQYVKHQAGEARQVNDAFDIGAFEVQPTPTGIVSGKVTYVNNLTTTSVPFTTLTAAGSIPLSTMTDSNGDYSLSGFGSGAYTIIPSKTNQVNGISNLDASTIAQHVAGLITLMGNQLIAADTSGNGTVSSLDAAYIAQFVASIPNPSITGTWKFLPTSRSYPNVLTNQTDQDYSAILVGDVTGNWNPAGALRFDLSAAESDLTTPAKKAAKEEGVMITASANESAVEETAMTLDLMAAETTGAGILGYQFDVLYDAAVIEPQAIGCDVSDTLSSGMTSVCRVSETRVLKVVVFGATPLTGSGTLLKLNFKVVGARGSTFGLSIKNFMFNEGMPNAVTVKGQW